MNVEVYDAKDANEELGTIEDADPTCGADFCDSCGDCLKCYPDFCVPNEPAGHRWVIYAPSMAAAHVQVFCVCGFKGQNHPDCPIHGTAGQPWVYHGSTE